MLDIFGAIYNRGRLNDEIIVHGIDPRLTCIVMFVMLFVDPICVVPIIVPFLRNIFEYFAK